MYIDLGGDLTVRSAGNCTVVGLASTTWCTAGGSRIEIYDFVTGPTAPLS